MQTNSWSLYLKTLNVIEIAAMGKPIKDCDGVDKVVRKSRF
jgi:hypothetical protein